MNELPVLVVEEFLFPHSLHTIMGYSLLDSFKLCLANLLYLVIRILVFNSASNASFASATIGISVGTFLPISAGSISI